MILPWIITFISAVLLIIIFYFILQTIKNKKSHKNGKLKPLDPKKINISDIPGKLYVKDSTYEILKKEKRIKTDN